ncbi:hypothetical protein ACIRQP_41490 [Streptomyces sp. NPDC102274]|uniref:hypothetical protein n=1 Tax=Streptomyces sp. NPDC102274 TaxID=3366151 RepID=UPI003805EFC4
MNAQSSVFDSLPDSPTTGKAHVSVLKRLAVAGSALALAVGAAVTVAPAAQALPSDCMTYLVDRGYTLTERRADACAYGDWNGIERFLCPGILTDTGVKESHVITACRLTAA